MLPVTTNPDVPSQFGFRLNSVFFIVNAVLRYVNRSDVCLR